MTRKIALIAHDAKKKELVDFVESNRSFFSRYSLVATGITGGLIMERTGLTIKRMQSGPLGGGSANWRAHCRRRYLAYFLFPRSTYGSTARARRIRFGSALRRS